jgi:hypothetical protein
MTAYNACSWSSELSVVIVLPHDDGAATKKLVSLLPKYRSAYLEHCIAPPKLSEHQRIGFLPIHIPRAIGDTILFLFMSMKIRLFLPITRTILP